EHGGQVVFLGEVSTLLGLHAGVGVGDGQRGAQLLAQLFLPALGLGIGFRLGRVGVDQNVGAARQVVDNDQFVDLQQHDVGRAVFLTSREGLGGRPQTRLHVAHGVIA